MDFSQQEAWFSLCILPFPFSALGSPVNADAWRLSSKFQRFGVPLSSFPLPDAWARTNAGIPTFQLRKVKGNRRCFAPTLALPFKVLLW